MTPRNDMDTADPQAADAFEATSGRSTFDKGEAISSHPASSTQRSRRYTRIAVSLPVVVRDQFGGREETRTQFVMVRGAVLATASNFRVGHKLTLQIAKTGRAAECHVVGLEHVAKDVPSVEVEFTREQQDFWPVQFPPEDLKTDSGSYRFRTGAPAMLGPQSSGHGDLPKHATAESPSIKSSSEIVSLADSIAGNSFSSTSSSTSINAPEKFTSRSAPVDSVAQFRAANRAAHRREQRRKAFYSALSLAALAVVAIGVQYWMQHRSEIAQVNLPRVSLPQVNLPQVKLPSISQVLPAAKPVEKPGSNPSRDETSAATIADTPIASTPEVAHSAPSSTASEAAAPPITPETKPAETQVAVRHEAMSASSRKPVEDAGEEPLAPPLQVEDSGSTPKPDVLNSVVAQTPMKAALLAPQPVRKAVPAKLVYSAPAQYPSMARQIHLEGEVIISLDVDPSGKVSAARAVSGPPILRAAALDAVKRWKYQPATLGDKPVVSTEVVKLQFKLK
ncbi:MAG: hypothetical protein DMG60_13520 [Acidobacteria bacterium]|nr:MAG: hypothetical protein DMG60_13520 [Acidobacteriota bacterium]